MNSTGYPEFEQPIKAREKTLSDVLVNSLYKEHRRKITEE